MKTVVCDFKKCGKPATKEVMVATGYTEATGNSEGETRYPPFTRGVMIERKDLCEKHFTYWARNSYEFFHGPLAKSLNEAVRGKK